MDIERENFRRACEDLLDEISNRSSASLRARGAAVVNAILAARVRCVDDGEYRTLHDRAAGAWPQRGRPTDPASNRLHAEGLAVVVRGGRKWLAIEPAVFEPGCRFAFLARGFDPAGALRELPGATLKKTRFGRVSKWAVQVPWELIGLISKLSGAALDAAG